MDLSWIENLPASTALLALGEPAHHEPPFTRLRNELLARLVDHGFRSIALETDRIAALPVDAYVREGVGTWAEVVATGFTHGFGRIPGNRRLVTWLREYNSGRPSDEQVAFYGFDGPLEISGPADPRPHLRRLADYVGAPVPEDSEPRLATDDLLTRLYTDAPRLVGASSVGAWKRAELEGKSAMGIFRYQAAAGNLAEMAALRGAWMAQNLLEIRAVEQRRGPTLVFAGHAHLQRYRSTMRMGELELDWSSAGSIVSALLGDAYVLITGALGASARLDLAAPPAGTFESLLAPGLTPSQGLPGATTRSDVTRKQPISALTAADLARSDAILYVPSSPAPEGPDSAELAARIGAMDGVETLRAGKEGGAPESSWGDYFFYAGSGRDRPFATIVHRDVPGFDEESHLTGRPDVYRLNIHSGRDEFGRRLGFTPADLEKFRASVPFQMLDQLLPSPVYAAQGWVSILSPGNESLPEVDELIILARDDSVRRQRRRAEYAQE